MISATVAAWALFGVDRSVISWPAKLRLREALKVAKRTSAGAWPGAGAADVGGSGYGDGHADEEHGRGEQAAGTDVSHVVTSW